MHISARVDYAVRALVGLASAAEQGLTAEALATQQALPVRFLEGILRDLRHGGFVLSQRGAIGGYRLARPAGQITVAEVMRALDGPLAEVRGERPEHRQYEGAAGPLQDVWVAVRASLRSVLDHVTIAQIADGTLPAAVTRHTKDPTSWQPR